MKLQLHTSLKLCSAFSVLLLLYYLYRLQRTPDQSRLWPIKETSLHYAQSSPGERAIEERMAHIRAVCKNHKYPNFRIFNLYYLPTTGVTWAPLFKAGSSTWKRFFIDQEVAANQTTNPRNLYNLQSLERFHLEEPIARSRGQSRIREFSEEEKGSVRFTIVRHPMARLVSHYRNSVSPHEVLAQWDVWMRDAIIGARRSSISSDEREKLLAEADDYISRAASEGESSPQQDNPFLNPPYATFAEMVDFIGRETAKGIIANGHWIPASQWLDICQNDFNLVVKLENGDLETPHLLSVLNLSEHSELYWSRANASGSKSVSNHEIERYLKQLTFAQQKILDDMYAFDYEVFGYEPFSV